MQPWLSTTILARAIILVAHSISLVFALHAQETFAITIPGLEGDSNWATDPFGCSSEGTLNTWVQGQKVAMSFKVLPGTRAKFYFATGTDGAKFYVHHDGQLQPMRRTTYNHLAPPQICQRIEYEWHDISPGDHTITFEHAGHDPTSINSTSIAYLRLNKMVLMYDESGPLVSTTDTNSTTTVVHCPPRPWFSKKGYIIMGVVGGVGLLSILAASIVFLLQMRIYRRHARCLVDNRLEIPMDPHPGTSSHQAVPSFQALSTDNSHPGGSFLGSTHSFDGSQSSPTGEQNALLRQQVRLLQYLLSREEVGTVIEGMLLEADRQSNAVRSDNATSSSYPSHHG